MFHCHSTGSFSMTAHGLPCWYELSTSDTDAAATFYAGIAGWSWADSAMPGMNYSLATIDGTMIAGMMKVEMPGQPVAWTFYVAVDSTDDVVKQAEALGAKAIVPPTDVPDNGRFSILIDPQGATFGVLQPLPGGLGGAFDQKKNGHGNWHDLQCADPAAALVFYGALFGWRADGSMPMGPDMTYHLIARDGLQFGGVFNASGPAAWKPYFGVASANAAVEQIKALGGSVLHGPDEIPGGAFTVDARDPQGARVAVVGPA